MSVNEYLADVPTDTLRIPVSVGGVPADDVPQYWQRAAGLVDMFIAHAESKHLFKYATEHFFAGAAIAKGKKSYTAPICSFNKGVCYENLNKTDDAVAAYKYAAEFADFGMAPHAYFSLGRILESKGDYAGAAEAYKTLNDKFAYEDWANLAKTRLITLQAEGKAE